MACEEEEEEEEEGHASQCRRLLTGIWNMEFILNPFILSSKETKADQEYVFWPPSHQKRIMPLNGMKFITTRIANRKTSNKYNFLFYFDGKIEYLNFVNFVSVVLAFCVFRFKPKTDTDSIFFFFGAFTILPYSLCSALFLCRYHLCDCIFIHFHVQ